jgi:hypothetical protein
VPSFLIKELAIYKKEITRERASGVLQSGGGMFGAAKFVKFFTFSFDVRLE